MSFFNKIKELTNKINEVESTVYYKKQDYIEIYERNIALEKELAQQTKELSMANKKMITLQHIIDMMTSSKPLETVLDNIVNSISNEFGYVHCAILEKMKDEKGDFIKIISQSGDSAIEALHKVIHAPLYTLRLNYSPVGVYAETMRSKEITQTQNLGQTLQEIIPTITDEQLSNILDKEYCKSMIIIPLSCMNRDFGWFVVFSSRDELATSETDFLSIFAKQIEMAITIAHLFSTVKEQAVTDGLTGLYNRRYFEEYLRKEVTRANRQKQAFSLIGLDLDFLKQINDKYGHSYGDLAIKTLADVIKNNARSIDIAARMGGEEFNIILPGIDSKGAMIAAERIRKTLEATEIETIGHITASIGVATYFEHTDNPEELIELTDQAMYQSKRNGRNRVTLATPISETSWQEIAINTFIDILSKHNIPVEKNLTKELCDKLKKAEQDSKSQPKETLYLVADMLTRLYNPLHEDGSVKKKVLLASSLAKRFDLPKEEIDNLKIAILMYDIGNLLIPQEILQKTTPLTEEEKKFIKEHPIIAARDILKPISVVQDILPIIEKHHENWDGSGYPNKLSKNEIPMSSQIILIIDSYFALTETRPYRAKLSEKEALEVIKQDAGKKWNTELVKEFIALINNELK